MAPVLSRSLATASLASLPSSSSFLLRNSNRNRVLNLTTAFVPQNGLRKRFSSSRLKWKYERRNHRFALQCKAAAVAEKEAADTSGEKFEYQAEGHDKYEFSDPARIQGLVKSYSQFVSFPICTWQEKSRTVEVRRLKLSSVSGRLFGRLKILDLCIVLSDGS